MKATYDAVNGYARYVFPMLLMFGGLWLAFRAVNVPWIADFLIAVEAEMNKVSWPSRAEMFRATLVVIFTIFGLAITLFGYDLLWRSLLELARGLGLRVRFCFDVARNPQVVMDEMNQPLDEPIAAGGDPPFGGARQQLASCAGRP